MRGKQQPRGISEEKENRTTRWAKGTFQGAVGACQTGMVIRSGRAQHLGWPNKLQIWCSQRPGWVAGSVLSLLSLSPAPAFSSANESGWDGLVTGAAVFYGAY